MEFDLVWKFPKVDVDRVVNATGRLRLVRRKGKTLEHEALGPFPIGCLETSDRASALANRG